MNTFTKHPQIQHMAVQEAIKSPYIGKHGKRKITLALEKAVKERSDDIVGEMMVVLIKTIRAMDKKIPEASFRDLIYGVDILTKNILIWQEIQKGRDIVNVNALDIVKNKRAWDLALKKK